MKKKELKTEKTDTEDIYKEISLNVKIDENEAKILKLVKEIESIVRSSLEYKNFIRYLIQELDIRNCSFFTNIDREMKVTIEFHHYPFTLFDITKTVLNKYLFNNIMYINRYEIAEEVLKLHYEFKVGLVPLTETVHELAHSGELFINSKQVYGNFETFYEEYKKYIDDDTIKKLKTIIRMSEENNSEEKVKKFNTVLEKKANIPLKETNYKKLELNNQNKEILKKV